MEWDRGDRIGHGNFCTVSLAISRGRESWFPPLMAVKSCSASHSASLVNEKSILDELSGCPHVVGCFGGSVRVENGEKLYNVLLEYAAGGSLAARVRDSGDRKLPELEIRAHARSILKGLDYIHGHGYVHCDIKPQNVLLFSSADGKTNIAKIADFGLAKKSGTGQDSKRDVRGTPLYMSPEALIAGEEDSPADVWALGCLVVELVTGAPAWKLGDMAGLLMRIGAGDEIPEIPGNMSPEGKDFLRKCFLKDPKQRWTAEMLLDHPFVATVCDRAASPSPRSPFSFPDWTDSVPSPSPEAFTEFCSWYGLEEESNALFSSPAARLRDLSKGCTLDWSDSRCWATVRSTVTDGR